MIYVRLDESKIPEEWKRKAADLLADLEKCTTPEERRKFIDEHPSTNGGKPIWSDLKDVLLEMSHGKCWYSEAPDTVSDWHVDHFRPKKRARDEDGTEREGYHWLAFEWTNFRIAGSFPNSPHRDASGVTRGKSDYFPLLESGQSASWENRDYSREIPLLLDPARRGDAECIVFDQEAIPKPADKKSPLMERRVKATNFYLFLDSPRLIDGRKKRWRECLDWIRELQDITPMELQKIDAQRYAQIQRVEGKIRRMTRPDQPYASMIRSCLRLQGMAFLIETPEGW